MSQELAGRVREAAKALRELFEIDPEFRAAYNTLSYHGTRLDSVLSRAADRVEGAERERKSRVKQLVDDLKSSYLGICDWSETGDTAHWAVADRLTEMGWSKNV